jgi:hypothetical protein
MRFYCIKVLFLNISIHILKKKINTTRKKNYRWRYSYYFRCIMSFIFSFLFVSVFFFFKIDLRSN